MKQTLIDAARQLAEAALTGTPPDILTRMMVELGGPGYPVVEIVPDAGCPQIRVSLVGPGGDRYELTRILVKETRLCIAH